MTSMNSVEGTGLRAGLPTELPDWRVAVPCRRCGHWLTSPTSVMAGISPRCAQIERRHA